MAELEQLGGSGELLQEGSMLPKRPREDSEMDITPMIDITFLLLIFFLVASKMDDSAKVDLPEARAAAEVNAGEAIDIIVQKGSGDEARVLNFNGDPFTQGDLKKQEEEIAKYIEAGLAGTAPFTSPKKYIVIRAEGEVREGEVHRIMEAIGRATEDRDEDQAISVLYVAVKHVE